MFAGAEMQGRKFAGPNAASKLPKPDAAVSTADWTEPYPAQRALAAVARTRTPDVHAIATGTTGGHPSIVTRSAVGAIFLQHPMRTLPSGARIVELDYGCENKKHVSDGFSAKN